MKDTAFVIAGRTFTSRLIIGTGKYSSHAVMARAHEASGADMVTVAVRRVNISDRSRESLLDYIDASRMFILPGLTGMLMTVSSTAGVASNGALNSTVR